MLIVEDQDTMRVKLREYLQSAYPDRLIREAANGREALERCRERPPQVVLMDIGLPDVNGLTLTAEIKKMLPGVGIVVVSSYSGSEYVQRAAAAGADAFVNKADITCALLPAVSAILAKGGAAPEPRQNT